MLEIWLVNADANTKVDATKIVMFSKFNIFPNKPILHLNFYQIEFYGIQFKVEYLNFALGYS